MNDQPERGQEIRALLERVQAKLATLEALSRRLTVLDLKLAALQAVLDHAAGRRDRRDRD